MRPRLLDSAAANLGRPMPARLSIDSNRFTLIDSGGNEKPHNMLYLDVVFVDVNQNAGPSKMYWGKEYNPNDTGDIPLCWSDNAIGPSSQAQTPQAPKCMTCPHNVIGSAISKFTGAKIKACVDMKKTAFILPGDPDNMIFLMTIKPGSFKNWANYCRMLGQQKFTDGSQPDLSDVVTRLEFESQGVLKFSPVAAVPGNQPLIAQREAAWAKNTTAEIVGQNDVPWSGQLAAPAQTQQLAPPPVQQVQPTVPFAPTAMQAPQPQPTATGFSTGAPMTSQNAPSPQQAPRRPRRTKAQIEADNAAASAPPQRAAPAPDVFIPPQQAAPAIFTNPQPAPPAPAFQPPAQQAVAPPSGQAADPMEIPAFLRREQPAAVAPAAPAQSFGLAQPAQADPAMLAAIADAFKLPT